MFFSAGVISHYAVYRAVFKRKNVVWRIFVRSIRSMDITGKRENVLKQNIKFFCKPVVSHFGTVRVGTSYCADVFLLKRRRSFSRFKFSMRKSRRRRRRFYSLKSLQYKKYVPLGAFKKKFYKFPFVCYAFKFILG